MTPRRIPESGFEALEIRFEALEMVRGFGY